SAPVGPVTRCPPSPASGPSGRPSRRGSVLDFLYYAVSWVLLRWHQLFTAIGLNKDSGLNWSLSIVFLVITARLLLFRLFIRQVKYQRHMQEIQPKLQAVREK